MISGLPCSILALFLAGCSAIPPVEQWGRDCRDEMDPARRLELVRQIMGTGDERAIPVLIECLDALKRMGKTPDRVYRAKAIVPNDTAPPEFWGLNVLTGQDFDLDVEKWSAWYESHRGRFDWDGGRRRFVAK